MKQNGFLSIIIIQSNFHVEKKEKNVIPSHGKGFDTDFVIDYATGILDGNPIISVVTVLTAKDLYVK